MGTAIAFKFSFTNYIIPPLYLVWPEEVHYHLRSMSLTELHLKPLDSKLNSNSNYIIKSSAVFKD